MVWEFNTKAVGVTFDGRQDNVRALQPGFRIFWEHEPMNQYDKNAIALFSDPAQNKSIGHLRKEVAEGFVRRLKAGVEQDIFVEQVTGGTGQKSCGVNLKVVVHGEREERK